MKISVNETSDTTLELSIEAPEESVAKAIEKETAEYRKKVQIPGFRKGKAPVAVILSQYGSQINSNAIENVVNESYREAVESENLHPIGPGNISDIDYNPGSPLKFKAQIEVEPNFEIGSLKKIKVEKPVHDVTDDMVSESIKRLQYRLATLEKKEDASAMGDHMVMDIQEIDPVSGVEIIGKKYPDSNLILGEYMFGPNIDEQLVGLKEGDTKIIKRALQPQMVVTPGAPEDKTEEQFKVSVKKVESVSLPEVDDELAKDLKYENTAAMREGMKKQLAAEIENNGKKEFRYSIEKSIVREVNPPVPEIMVKRFLDNLAEGIKQYSEKPVNEEQTKEDNKELAKEKVQWFMIKQKLIEQEKLAISEQEIDDFIQKFAEDNKADLKRLQIEYRSGEKRQNLRLDLLDNKLYNFIEQNIDVKEIKMN